ncbi:thioredoxin family protein [candidate division KSB1 bacterium]|nr:thioredoxin family protein [candidate division KSB1 bacterium]NIR69464.1 thioredoxin family protein [candidate division KSB1 bacterium]NIS22813.1 thioredoxin family protein [candidate division KSB1 bacterium]NIT69653.1 thioredoxin family protein [candidate division KSB1 bacterium]NIU23322.1 thioredoxin family protein [candidate division KSB1 bacterium]
MLLSVNRHNFREEVLESSQLVFVNFWVNWSEECKQMKMLMKKLDSELEQGCKIVEVDWEKDHKLAEKYRVFGTPSLLVFSDGELVGQYSGTLNVNEFFEETNAWLSTNSKQEMMEN